MNHEVEIIQQNPFRLGVSFPVSRSGSGLLELLGDGIADRLGMARRSTAANQEEIGKGTKVRHVQDLYVLGFVLQGGMDGSPQ